MGIIKRIKANYASVPRCAMDGKHMSLKAKGLLSYLLCMPDNWQIYVSELANHHKEHKDTIGKALNELIANGYVERKRARIDGKFSGYDYTVYDTPITEKTVTVKTVSEKTVYGKSNTNNIDSNNIDNTKKDSNSTFPDFWTEYGKHGNRKKAETSYNRLSKKDQSEAIEGAKKYVVWLKAKGDFKSSFQKHGATYINGKCWQDELPKLEKTHGAPLHASTQKYSQGSNYNPNI